MRILGFSRRDWKNYLTGKPKMDEDEFSTFRFSRQDKDWEVGEKVQVVYKPRRKGGGEFLGIAEITSKEPRNMVKVLVNESPYPTISPEEVQADGFFNYYQMWEWLFTTYHGGQRFMDEPMNRLTLRWVEWSKQ